MLEFSKIRLSFNPDNAGFLKFYCNASTHIFTILVNTHIIFKSYISHTHNIYLIYMSYMTLTGHHEKLNTSSMILMVYMTYSLIINLGLFDDLYS